MNDNGVMEYWITGLLPHAPRTTHNAPGTIPIIHYSTTPTIRPSVGLLP